MFRISRISLLPLLLLALAAASCHGISPPSATAPSPIYAPMSTPMSDATFTATSEVRALDWDGKALWAATAGGVLRVQNGAVKKWTRHDGLPSNEAFDLTRENGSLSVHFPVARAVWKGEKWHSEKAPEWKQQTLTAEWNGEKVMATLDGLQIGDAKFGLPAHTSGTHISAILPRGKVLLAAVYGDGLWRFDGKTWTRGPIVPDQAREILSLAGGDEKLWIGTRRNGIFERVDETWKTLPSDDNEPFAHNVQNMAEFDGVLWASTLDDGLIARTGKGWRHVAPPQISSSAPRQMLEWRSKLYVRHGGGMVDAFDGASWEKDALKSIPRRGVYALAGTDKLLFAAGWGGWGEWDGQTWAPHYDLPALKGVPLMNITSQGEDIWIGTQSRGIAKWTRATNEIEFYDERDGLRDDWITALFVDGERVWAGTFGGGLHVYDKGEWRLFEVTKGENITAIVSDRNGGVWATTRHGLFWARGAEAKNVSKVWLDDEQQALYASEKGLWIGTRTSLSYLANCPDR